MRVAGLAGVSGARGDNGRARAREGKGIHATHCGRTISERSRVDQAPDVIQNRNAERLQPGFALVSVGNENAIGVHGPSHFIIMFGIAHDHRLLFSNSQPLDEVLPQM